MVHPPEGQTAGNDSAHRSGNFTRTPASPLKPSGGSGSSPVRPRTTFLKNAPFICRFDKICVQMVYCALGIYDQGRPDPARRSGGKEEP